MLLLKVNASLLNINKIIMKQGFRCRYHLICTICVMFEVVYMFAICLKGDGIWCVVFEEWSHCFGWRTYVIVIGRPSPCVTPPKMDVIHPRTQPLPSNPVTHWSLKSNCPRPLHSNNQPAQKNQVGNVLLLIGFQPSIRTVQPWVAGIGLTMVGNHIWDDLSHGKYSLGG